MRDYQFFDQCLDALTTDVYAQPPDKGHTAWAIEALEMFVAEVYHEEAEHKPADHKALDIGCGQAFMCPHFEDRGIDWTGVTIGDDYKLGRGELGMMGKDANKLHEADMTFLPFEDNSFDLIFARHVLEHSPFPVITLMEWARVAKEKSWLCLVAPAPNWWLYGGQNHYSIVPKPLVKWWLTRAGWHPINEKVMDTHSKNFQDHLLVLQAELKKHEGRDEDAHREATNKVMARYPSGPVEFRFICKKGEEVTS